MTQELGLIYQSKSASKYIKYLPSALTTETKTINFRVDKIEKQPRYLNYSSCCYVKEEKGKQCVNSEVNRVAIVFI